VGPDSPLQPGYSAALGFGEAVSTGPVLNNRVSEKIGIESQWIAGSLEGRRIPRKKIDGEPGMR